MAHLRGRKYPRASAELKMPGAGSDQVGLPLFVAMSAVVGLRHARVRTHDPRQPRPVSPPGPDSYSGVGVCGCSSARRAGSRDAASGKQIAEQLAEASRVGEVAERVRDGRVHRGKSRNFAKSTPRRKAENQRVLPSHCLDTQRSSSTRNTFASNPSSPSESPKDAR